MATTISVEEGSNYFYPLTKYSFVLCIDGIDAFLVKRTKPDSEHELYLSLHDAVAPNGATAVMEMIRKGFEHAGSRSGAPRQYETLFVKMLNPAGTVVQMFEYNEAHVIDANFNDLAEYNSDVTTIDITIKFGAKILHY